MNIAWSRYTRRGRAQHKQTIAKRSDESSTGQLAEAMRKVSELEMRLADARENEVNHQAEPDAQEQRLLEQAATQQAIMLEEMTSAALLSWNEKQKEQEVLVVVEKDETKRFLARFVREMSGWNGQRGEENKTATGFCSKGSSIGAGTSKGSSIGDGNK